MELKTCTKCGHAKQLTEFYELKHNRITQKNKKPKWVGSRHKSQCKQCVSKRQREYREKNREGVLIRKRQRYQKNKDRNVRKKRLEIGYYIRNGFKYVFESPINDLKNCPQCHTLQPLENFYKRSPTCKTCHSQTRKEKYVPRPRKKKTPEEIREHDRNYMRLYTYLQGDGCCFYCGETNPFMLNNHHIFGRKNSDFTITLCENHHAPITRGLPFILENWYATIETEKTNR